MQLNNFTYFYPEKPFLMSIEQDLFNEINNNKNWIAEKKYNGIRLQLHYINGQFMFWNRHGAKIKYNPDSNLLKELNKIELSGYWLFDGELRNNKIKGINNKIMIYDVFIANNDLLINKPFIERRQILESIFKVDAEPLGLTRQYNGDFKDLFNKVIVEEEIEGLVFKKLTGLLKLSRRIGNKSSWMYKVRKPTKNYRF